MSEYSNEYKKPYYILLNGIEDALKVLQRGGSIGETQIILIRAELDAEEAFVSFGEDAEKIGDTKIIKLFEET